MMFPKYDDETGHQLHRCGNPLCDRLTTADHCCSPCASAREGHYEIHEAGPLAHSEGCNERAARRTRAVGSGSAAQPKER